MIFFKRKLLYPKKPLKVGTNIFDRLHKEYLKHLQSIRPRLPQAAWQLACLSFHDASIISVKQPSKRELSITLDGGYWGSGYDFINDRVLDGRYTTLRFCDVKQAWVPSTIVGDVWLYQEMNLSDIAAFDYQALLATDEIRIQSNAVDINSSSTKNGA